MNAFGVSKVQIYYSTKGVDHYNWVHRCFTGKGNEVEHKDNPKFLWKN